MDCKHYDLSSPLKIGVNILANCIGKSLVNSDSYSVVLTVTPGNKEFQTAIVSKIGSTVKVVLKCNSEQR
jgi:hypothetical protein